MSESKALNPSSLQREDFPRMSTSSTTMLAERAHLHRPLGQEAQTASSTPRSPSSGNNNNNNNNNPDTSQAGRSVRTVGEGRKKTGRLQTCRAVTEDDSPELLSEEPGVPCSLAAAEDDSSARSVFPDPSATASSAKGSTSSATSGWKNIDTALHTLKSELMAMREQDLQLLKQLIHINDNIRRLKRARWLQRGGAARTVSCGLLGARGSATLPPGGSHGGAATGGGHGKDRASMLLLRQRSEPGLLGGVPCRRVSALTSTSSFGTIEDEDEEEEEEEADSLYGSSSDLPSDSSSPLPSPFSPSKATTSTTSPGPLVRSTSAYTSLTFTQEELWRGESSYGEILKRNIRLWKWSVARERDSGAVEGHPCVL